MSEMEFTDKAAVWVVLAVAVLLFFMACNMDLGEWFARRIKWPVIVVAFAVVGGLIAAALLWVEP